MAGLRQFSFFNGKTLEFLNAIFKMPKKDNRQSSRRFSMMTAMYAAIFNTIGFITPLKRDSPE